MDARIFSIVEQLNKWKGHEDALLQDGTILICRIPDASPLGYLHKIFPPLDTIGIEKVEMLLKVDLPNAFVDFLLVYNGMNLFNANLSIFGVRRSYDKDHFRQFFQPYDIIIENLGRHERDDYIKFGTYKNEYDLYFKQGEDDKVYIMQKYTTTIVKVFPSFYETLQYLVSSLSIHYNETGERNKMKQLFSTDIDSHFVYSMGEIY